MQEILTFQGYSPAADVGSVVICAIFCLLLRSTYTIKHQNLIVFRHGVAFVVVASTSNIIYHGCQRHIEEVAWIWIYLLREIRYLSLMLTFVIFFVYIRNLVELSGEQKKMFDRMNRGTFLVLATGEIVFSLWKFWLDPDTEHSVKQLNNSICFGIFYLIYLIFMVYTLLKYQKKFITKIFQCIWAVMSVSYILILIQVFRRQTTYTCFSFTFPIMAALFLFHYNSYDPDTGTLDASAFNAYIQDLGEKEFSMIFLYLKDMNMQKMQKMSEDFFHFNEQFFKSPITFRLRDSKLAMVYEDSRNPDAESKIQMLLEDFKKLYKKYKIEYKIILMHSDRRITNGMDYLGLDEYAEQQIDIDQVHQCGEREIIDYLREQYIVGQLKDINQKEDLDDARVRVFAQPILNTLSGDFTSAEALMRLELPECGMVFPDQFIPLAERYEYIHMLSRIILYKSCKQVKYMKEKGYQIERISVNFSITELKNQEFGRDVCEIIELAGAQYDWIAIELTESRNAKDYEMVTKVMNELKGHGIKFYLDDFGTGYSNFERIMGLPVDIIKFDRSLTIASAKSEREHYLISKFADLFKESGYQILFEGIEDEADEKRCRNMKAAYLQGFKYSKPVPIERLEGFMTQDSR